MGGFGRDSYAGIAKTESVYGTLEAVPAWQWFRIISERCGRDQEVRVRKVMQGASPLLTMMGNQNIPWGVDAELHYEGLLRILKHAFGGYAFSANTPVSGTQTHTFTCADALPVGFTSEICKANIPAGTAFLYKGVNIDTLEFIFDPDEIVVIKADGFAQSETPNSTKATGLAYHADHPVYWHYAGVLKFAGTTPLEFVKGSIKINNNLRKRFLMHNQTRQPARNLKREVTGSFTVEFDDLTLYNKFTTPTLGDFLLTYTSTELITGSTYYTASFSMPNIQLQKPTGMEITDEGLVEVTYPFISLATASLGQLTIAIINNEVTVT